MKKEKGFRLHIKDKAKIKGYFCPPHRMPHKLPFQKPVTNEQCHYHNHFWRMCHHRPYCWLFCKNYKNMIAEYNKRKK